MSYVTWIRGQVGRQKIFLVFASVVVRDEDGRILLQRRTDFDWWGIPGGVLEPEEDIETCARREVAEETGLEVGPLQLVGVYNHPHYDVVYSNGDEVQQFTVCFTGVVTGGRMQPDGIETTQQQFFPAANIKHLDLPLWYAAMVRDTIRFKGEPILEPPYRNEQLSSQIDLLRQLDGQSGAIIAVSAMGVAIHDGRVLAVRNSPAESWRLPVAYCCLGENATQTAARAVKEQAAYRSKPQRIIGVYSRPGLAIPGLEDDLHHVGLVFQAALEEGQKLAGGAADESVTFLDPAALAEQQAALAGALYEQIATQLTERGAVISPYFVC